MLNQVGEKQAECVRQAAEAEQRAVASTDPEIKADQERVAQSWRKLARGYEFEAALGRFILFNKKRQKSAASALQQTARPPSSTVEEAEDSLDRLARIAAGIKPYSWSAILIGVACLAGATVIRF